MSFLTVSRLLSRVLGVVIPGSVFGRQVYNSVWIQAAVSIKISNLLICFCSIVLYLIKIIISNICILYCLVLLNSVLFNLVCFDNFFLDTGSLNKYKMHK